MPCKPRARSSVRADLNSRAGSATYPRGSQQMNRTGLVIALAVALVVGLIFGLWPELDLTLAAPFFDPQRDGFWRSLDPTYWRWRDIVTWLVTLVAAPAIVAPLLKLIRPRRPLLIP